jgi:uncharacterized membrane protein YgcG
MLKLLCAALAAAMCLATPQVALANSSPEKLAAMADLLDKLDREDLLDGLEKANGCTTQRNFACTDTTLQKIKKLINGPADKKLWEMAFNYRQAEQQRINDEVRAEREREERIAAQERRAEAALERQRQEEEARERRAQEAREAAVNRQALMAIVGAAAIGKATSGSNYTDAQRRALVESYTKDRINAIDGVQTNNFGQQAETVKREADTAHRTRMAAAEEARRQQAEQMRVALAERRAEEARAASADAQRRAAAAQARPVTVAAVQPELPKYQPQVVTIPSWPQTCPPGSVPARHPNGTPVTAAPGAYCIKDPNASTTQASNTATGKTSGNGGGSGTSGGTAAGGGAGGAGASGGALGGGSTVAGGSTTSPGGSDKKDEAPKKPPKELFRKTPATPPPGDASEGLTTPKGNYKCAPVNAYAKQHEKAAGQLASARYDAPYRSGPRCQARCDLLAWREEILNTYKYRGSWSCSVPSVGLWSSIDSAGDYRGYHDGKNDDSCTCVTSNDTPITFTP